MIQAVLTTAFSPYALSAMQDRLAPSAEHHLQRLSRSSGGLGSRACRAGRRRRNVGLVEELVHRFGGRGVGTMAAAVGPARGASPAGWRQREAATRHTRLDELLDVEQVTLFVGREKSDGLALVAGT